MLRARRRVLYALKPIALAFALVISTLLVLSKLNQLAVDLGTSDVAKRNNPNYFCRFRPPKTTPCYEWKQVGNFWNFGNFGNFGNSLQTHLFSAFLERKGDKYSILVLGITSGIKRNYLCRVWSVDLKNQIVLETVMEQILDVHNKKFNTCTIKCEFNAEEIYQPAFVSIVERKCQSPSNVLVLQNALHPSARNDVPMKTSDDGTKVNFTICLSPLNSNYDAHQQLIEWIEINRMFGVQRFLVYNHSSSSNIAIVLKHYKDEGILEVIPWNVPVKVAPDENGEEEVHYFSQKTALNDCFHRAKNYSRFIINVDVDEIIVPRKAASYLEILQQSFETEFVDDSNKDMSLESFTYVVRNSFFHINKSRDFFSKTHLDPTIDSLKEDIFRYDVRSLWMTKREMWVYPSGVRSKLIVGSRNTLTLEIHNTFHNNHMITVSENSALLHHYRPLVLNKDAEDFITTDEYMHQFASQIIRRLKEVYDKIKVFHTALNTPFKREFVT